MLHAVLKDLKKLGGCDCLMSVLRGTNFRKSTRAMTLKQKIICEIKISEAFISNKKIKGIKAAASAPKTWKAPLTLAKIERS